MIQELFIAGQLVEVENLDFQAEFQISDLVDIADRYDNISKTISIKGTPHNEKIFNNLFNLNRVSQESETENTGTFFKINKAVPAEYYENGLLIFKGQLIVEGGYIDNGCKVYDCRIKGDTVSFFKRLGDKYLSDLSFSGDSHTYNVSSIASSWLFSGMNYVYPFVDYGNLTTIINNGVTDVNKVHYSNFRPAIYAKSYLNKIFEGMGYTYSISGSTDFISDFNKLIVLNDEESLSMTKNVSSYFISLNRMATTIMNGNGVDSFGANPLSHTLSIPFDGSYLINYIQSKTFYNKNDIVFKFTQDISTDFKIELDIEMKNKGTAAFSTFLQLSLRDAPTDNDSIETFVQVKDVKVGDYPSGTNNRKTVILDVPYKAYKKNQEIAVQLISKSVNGGTFFGSNVYESIIYGGSVKSPNTLPSTIETGLQLGDTITPKPVSGVRQSEFITSLRTLFNFFIYPHPDDDKHLVFQPYDDFYQPCSEDLRALTAKDYTQFIDAESIKFKGFDEYAKEYVFKYKEDSDYWNDDYYRKRYGLTYGDYTSTNTAGNGEQVEVDVIFSPTVITEIRDARRIIPSIYKLDSSNIKSGFKSNIRLLFYNGLKNCADWRIGTMASDYSSFDSAVAMPYTYYPQASHIRYEDGFTNFNVKWDLLFGTPKEYLFNTSIGHPNVFTKFYLNKILEYSHPDSKIVELDILLNEYEISTLDFRTPIYLNTVFGDGYFKIVKIDFTGSNTLSTITLQQIIV